MDEKEVSRPFDDRAVADAREHFLSGPIGPDGRVRQMILASWQRSRDSEVGLERLNVPFVREPDFQAPLCRSAAPIFDTLAEQLRHESVSIILADQAGLVLDRRCFGTAIIRQLDEVRLAPGFSYAEEFAGTNGIGTALSSGQATLVEGHEHYSDELGQFACAGAPIRHPTRGNVVGLVDLTAWSHAPGAMLSALAFSTARQIEMELLAQSGLREQVLFSKYTKTSKRSTGPVLALNNDVIMTNGQFRQVLDAREQESLTAHAIDTMRTTDHEVMRTVELPSGRMASLAYTPVQCATGPAGGVFRIRLGPSAKHAGASILHAGRAGTSGLAYRQPPGLAGTGVAWTRCVQQIDSCYRSGVAVALEGELGVGKQAVLRAIHRLHNPNGRFRVITAPEPLGAEAWFADLAEDLVDPDTLIVLARAEQLEEEHASAFADLVVDAFVEPDRHARVAMTVTAGASTPLRAIFPRMVEVPPLRHHIDDLSELVPYLLGQLTREPGEQLRCSQAAMDRLSRLNWPGNVAQLHRVLLAVFRHRHAGTIELADLPAECHSNTRHVLSPIEALERDAIVKAICDDGGTPTTAAKTLGMSRATMYRRIQQYSITLPITLPPSR